MILLDFSKCLLPHASTMANAAPTSICLIQVRKDKLLLAASDRVKLFPRDARKLLLPYYGPNRVIGPFFQQERLQNYAFLFLRFFLIPVGWTTIRENKNLERQSGQPKDIICCTWLLNSSPFHRIGNWYNEAIIHELVSSASSIHIQLWLYILHFWLLCCITSLVTIS